MVPVLLVQPCAEGAVLDRDYAADRSAEALELRGRLSTLRRAVIERLGQLLPEALATRPLGRKGRLPPPQALEQVRAGAEEAAVLLGGATCCRQEQPSHAPALRGAEQHASHRDPEHGAPGRITLAES